MITYTIILKSEDMKDKNFNKNIQNLIKKDSSLSKNIKKKIEEYVVFQEDQIEIETYGWYSYEILYSLYKICHFTNGIIYCYSDFFGESCELFDFLLENKDNKLLKYLSDLDSKTDNIFENIFLEIDINKNNDSFEYINIKKVKEKILNNALGLSEDIMLKDYTYIKDDVNIEKVAKKIIPLLKDIDSNYNKILDIIKKELLISNEYQNNIFNMLSQSFFTFFQELTQDNTYEILSIIKNNPLLAIILSKKLEASINEIVKVKIKNSYI